MNENTNIYFDIHVHRSTLVIEHVKLGRYQLGLCPLHSRKTDQIGLVTESLCEEPMIIVPCSTSTKTSKSLPVITIEQDSATWRGLGDQILAHPTLREYGFLYVESFAAAFQMAKAGFGHALLPAGVARSLGYTFSHKTNLKPSLKRKILLFSRKNIFHKEAYSSMSKSMCHHASKLF